VFPGAFLLILATLVAAGTGVDVRTTATCPTAQGISERLRPLLPSATGERDVALVDVIEARPDGATDMLIRLLRPDTSEVGNRRVGLTGTCDEMAEAVAAILAAWETDPRSEDTPADEPVALPAKNEPVAVAGSLSKTGGWELLLGAGAGAGLVGGVAAYGTVEGSAGKEDSHWQVRVGASAQTARTLDLPPTAGHADWKHTSFAAGLIWRTLGSAWPFSADAGPVLGWASLSGTGLLTNRQQQVFEYGGTAGVRLGHSWGRRLTLWAEARTTLWLLNEQATAKDPNPLIGVQARRDVPPVDAMVGLGLSLALFP
jgi:hypothetical protein